MSPRQLQQLTDRQLQIMGVLWDKGAATVADVHTAMRRTKLARKTVATLLSRLEDQRLVKHDVVGREFLYRAMVTRDQVARAKVRTILELVLGGNIPSLLRHALESEEVAPGDVERIEEMIRRSTENAE